MSCACFIIYTTNTFHSLQLPGITAKQAEAKWNNIKAGYQKYVENKSLTGRGTMKEPEFSDILDSILKSRPSTNPMEYVFEAGLETSQDPETPKTKTSTLKTTPSNPSKKRLRPPTRRESTNASMEELCRLQREHNEKMEAWSNKYFDLMNVFVEAYKAKK